MENINNANFTMNTISINGGGYLINLYNQHIFLE